MLKKLLLIALCCLITCGCSIEYNLEIVNGNFNESMDILGIKNNPSFNENVINHTKIWPYPAYNYIPMEAEEPIEKPDNNYYKPNYFDNDKYGVNFSYFYNLNDYKYATIPNRCFNSFNVYTENNTIFITTSPQFRCFNYYPELDDIKITIKTNHELDSTNCPNIRKEEDYHYYTWNISKTDSNEIKLNLSTNKYTKKIKNDNKNNNKKVSGFFKNILKSFNGPVLMVVYVIIVAIPISLIIFIISKNNSKSNKL